MMDITDIPKDNQGRYLVAVCFVVVFGWGWGIALSFMGIGDDYRCSSPICVFMLGDGG